MTDSLFLSCLLRGRSTVVDQPMYLLPFIIALSPILIPQNVPPFGQTFDDEIQTHLFP